MGYGDIGYCLYRIYHIHKACMFVGGGRNGKSTALSLLKKLLGENNVANKELQSLVYNRFAVSALYGKLANISADISNKALERTGLFKSLTGGDTVDAEKKFKESFSFVNYAKLIFSANAVPQSQDNTYAYFSRWLMISFPNTFEGKNCKPNLLNELSTQEEMSGLFNWSMEGLRRVLRTGGFSYNKTVEEVTELYKTMSDPVYAFCNEFVITSDGEHILKEDFREAYYKWCEENKLPKIASNILTGEIAKHLHEMRTGRTRKNGKQVQAFMHIAWKLPENNDENGDENDEKGEKTPKIDDFLPNPAQPFNGRD